LAAGNFRPVEIAILKAILPGNVQIAAVRNAVTALFPHVSPKTVKSRIGDLIVAGYIVSQQRGVYSVTDTCRSLCANFLKVTAT
jgi:predicted transcriptional regulator